MFRKSPHLPKTRQGAILALSSLLMRRGVESGQSLASPGLWAARCCISGVWSSYL